MLQLSIPPSPFAGNVITSRVGSTCRSFKEEALPTERQVPTLEVSSKLEWARSAEAGLVD
jgi:hypothetical protein